MASGAGVGLLAACVHCGQRRGAGKTGRPQRTVDQQPANHPLTIAANRPLKDLYLDTTHEAMPEAMQKYKPQFIQINYSIGERNAEVPVLSMARDMEIAVMIIRPYIQGCLFGALKGQDLPGWVHELADSWAQFFLKFIISHPAVTCVIPGTDDTGRLKDNPGAEFGRLPLRPRGQGW